MTNCERARDFYLRELVLARLRLFRNGLTVAELARGLRLKRSETNRLLASMRRRKLVCPDAGGDWRIGPRRQTLLERAR